MGDNCMGDNCTDVDINTDNKFDDIEKYTSK